MTFSYGGHQSPGGRSSPRGFPSHLLPLPSLIQQPIAVQRGNPMKLSIVALGLLSMAGVLICTYLILKSLSAI
ncbi:hypothetical protein PA15_0301810 [Pseudomonas aeruginosa HB15]|nr:hypothetical protein U769_11060 [Pseudomonas aeruginosa MTB-1]ESQ67042.1 hypothetical protein PA15_0301810 [Pseudomonas aeruginosa HB15]ESR68120.1 hypothetical protein T266_28055 [Pseudomonas aeruginosa VRFPA05]